MRVTGNARGEGDRDGEEGAGGRERDGKVQLLVITLMRYINFLKRDIPSNVILTIARKWRKRMLCAY